MGIGDWITGLKEQAPHLFMQSTGSGGGGGNRPGGPDMSKASSNSKIAEGLRSGTSPVLS
jgi:hypothetical protein